MMKKIVTLILALLISVCFTCSCDKHVSDASATENYLQTITELENELALLKREQNQKNSESEKRIAELTEKLNMLSKENDTEESKEDESTETPFTGFKYSVLGNEAAITGYYGEEKNIVIPATVDGYRVTSVADSAFEDTPINSVIISEGITSIGWFAFNGCTELTSVIVPASVSSIGYSAFGIAGAPLTVYCHSGSYALSYAKSFGLTYAVI